MSNVAAMSVTALHCAIGDLLPFCGGRIVPEDTLQSRLIHVELVYRELLAKESLSGLDVGEQQALMLVRNALRCLENMLECINLNLNTSRSAPSVLCTGSVGRPRFQISKEAKI